MSMRICLSASLLLLPGCLSREIDAFLDGLPPCTESTSATDGGSSTSASTGPADETTDETSGSAAGASAEASSGSDATTSASTSDSSTSAATAGSTTSAPVCGDGVVEGGEECDDGNDVPDDGCSEVCAADVRVFVTSVAYSAGYLDGLHLADATCFNRADDAGLADPLRFRAFLSDSRTDARDRFFRGEGRLVMVNGLVLADSWDALLDGTELANPLEVTEKSETYHGPVWTGTRPDGTAVPDSTHCADWTSDSGLDRAYYGYSDEVTGEWLLADQLDNPAPCFTKFPIYCFEDLDHA